MGVADNIPFSKVLAAPLRNGLTRPKAVRGEGVKMVNMGEIFAHERIGEVPMDRVPLSGRERDSYLLEPGDLLFARQSLVLSGAGRCSVFLGASEPVTFESHIIRARIDKTTSDPFFYFCFFRSRPGRDAIESIVEQVAAAGIRGSDLANLQVPKPPLREQRAIARILGTLDDKIELNRRLNQTLEAMARAIFKSWFMDFDPVRAKTEGRDPGLPKHIADLFPDSFEESELGEIPAGWRVLTVEDIAEINAWTLSRSDPLPVIDYIEISEVMRGEISTIVRYARGEEPSRARRRLRHGDTVLSTVRPDRAAHFLCLHPSETLIASTGFAVLSPRAGDWAYLYAATTRHEVGEELGRLADGGAYPAVRPEAVGKLFLIVPKSPDLRVKFQEIVGPLFERADKNRMESRTLAGLRDTLLPKLISGELQMKVAEETV